jgi:hydrogenase maturation protein HypF
VSTALRRERIRIRGLVQGVGFRPTVFRVAERHGVRGEVLNDGEGVLIHAWADLPTLDAFVEALAHECPPLARIEAIVRAEVAPANAPEAFQIAPSEHTRTRTGVSPDAAACAACLSESQDPWSRRYRYPFTNCTHCGPRLSIVRGVPYDRAQTTMAGFVMCDACRAEYDAARDRRFHAQPNACHACGPRAWLVRADGRALSTAALTQLDDVDAACTLLQRGEIVAIKGVGGYHLACDATRADVVSALREKKGRERKPFALMARDVDVVRRYAVVSEAELALLRSAAAPIVLLARCEPARTDEAGLAHAVAPGQSTLGFMLPYTPLHQLLLRRMARPIVLTSGNVADEPQVIDDAEAVARLGALSPYLLVHDRAIATRVDDSVVRVMAGRARVLRRARGYAPLGLPLPPGFLPARPTIALGAELKNTFCLLAHDQATLSQHIGDLENAAAFADYQHNLELYRELYQLTPERLVIDAHPEYLSSKLGRRWAEREGLGLGSVQHHHAHVAACLADNAWPLDAGPVLGLALDGLGYGEGGELWGGELLLADYRRAERVGTFKPVALLGGERAMHEPWRNTYAHLMAELGWADLALNFSELELYHFLEQKPRATLDAMLASGAHAPLASSCGRLFDAVAAALGVCRDRACYEGQAAVELEALVDRAALDDEGEEGAYPFAIPRLGGKGLPYVEPIAMWRALLGDLILGTRPGVISARFHKGLARALVQLVVKASQQHDPALTTVALTGGVFHNRVLLEQVLVRLEALGFRVLTHERIPAGDGGLALGQALIDAAREQGCSISF